MLCVIFRHKISSINNGDKVKIIIYIRDYGHFLRAKEFKSSILNNIDKYSCIILLNSSNKNYYNEIKKEFPNIIVLKNFIKIKDFMKFVLYAFDYLFYSNYKSFLKCVCIYHKNIYKNLKNDFSHLIFSENVLFINFNDQPIDVTSIETNLKKLDIVNKSIVYQHGIIRLPEFYFPSKSDFFYGYGFHNTLREKFNRSNIYKTKLVEVGNLKYMKNYLPIDINFDNNILLIPGPKIVDVFSLLKSIKDTSYSYSIKFHPGMKFKEIIKFFLPTTIKIADKIEFNKYSIIITEVSTVGLEALAEGKMVGVLDINNYKIPDYFANETIPKIKRIDRHSIKSIIEHYETHADDVTQILNRYFS